MRQMGCKFRRSGPRSYPLWDACPSLAHPPMSETMCERTEKAKRGGIMDHAAGLPRAEKDPIAVVGIGCRFPGGVDGPKSYWELLSAGRDARIDIPRERWQVEKFYDPDLASGTSRVRR